MENIDKIKCVLIDFENNDKTLDEAANEILRLFSVVGRSEQLAHCTDDDHNARRFFGGEKQCGKCRHPLR